MDTDLGTIYKLNLHIEGLPCPMDDVEFNCKVWTWKKCVEIPKADMIRVDADNYILTVDSSLLGRGTVHVQTTVMVPDDDIPGGFRKELYTEQTCIKVD